MTDQTYVLEQPASGPICDFCSSPDIHWAYPARDFRTEGTITAAIIQPSGMTLRDSEASFASGGGWAACNVCAALIRRGDRDRLARRSAKAQLRIHAFLRENGVSLASVIRMIRPLHDDFWKNREGDPIPATRHDREDPTR